MRDLGDIQTPLALVAEICDVLARHGRSWSRLLDPTCGQGNMIVGVLADPRFAITEVHGIEVQSAHLQVAQQRVTQGWGDIPVTYRQCNVFTVDFRHDLQWQHQGPLLVLGNPPMGSSLAQEYAHGAQTDPRSIRRICGANRGIES